MKSVFNICSFLKTPLFILLFTCTVSTVRAEITPPETAAHYAGKGLASPILLTEEDQAWLDQRHTVRVRVAATPPFLMTNPLPQGISVDYLKVIGKRFGINFSFVENSEITWKEVVNDLTGEHKYLDLLPFITRTPAREQSIAFTHDYFSSPWVIINRTDSEFVTRMEDLNGKNVAAENGFVIMDLIKNRYPQIRIVPVTSTLEALKSLASGTSDAYIGNLTIASYFIQSNGLNNLKIAASTPFGSHDIAAGVRKDWPELASIIDKGLAAMSAAEESEIRSRWLSVRYEHGVNIKNVLILGAGLTAAFSLVIAVVFMWNRRLRREINNRIMAEEALKKSTDLRQESSQMIEGIINSIPVRVFWKDKHLVYLGCNAVFAHDAGFADPKDLIGKDDFQMGWSEQAELYRADDRAIIESGCARLLIEETQTTPTGNTITLLTSKLPLRNSEGEIYGLLGTYIDITERKQTEDALRESEANFRQMFEKHDAIMLLVEPQTGLILDANKAATTFYGYENSKLCTMNISEINVLSAEQIADELQKALHEERNYFVFTHKSADGKERIVEVHSSPILFKENRVLFSIIHDITGRKKAEVALKENVQRLELAQNVAKAGIWDWDVVSGQLEWSRQMFNLFGLDKQKTMASFEAWRSTLHPEDLEIASRRIDTALKARMQLNSDYRILLPDGQTRWINAVGKGEYDIQGRPVRMIGVCIDITERKQAEEFLQQKAKELRASNVELEQFNRAVVGRELRMIELKEEIDALCRRLGEAPHYGTTQLEVDRVPGVGATPAVPEEGGS